MITHRSMRARLAGRLTFRAAAGLALGLVTSSAAQAQVQCGDIIGPNVSVTLQEDLLCSTATGGVTVVGPATLDLNGHRIECAEEDTRPIGVALVGRRAQLRDGYVGSCLDGVDIAGVGAHRVERVDAAFNQVHGFRITSDGNVLKGNRSSGNDLQGFVVDWGADRNVLQDNSTLLADGVRNGHAGFRVSGHKNKLRRNTAVGDGEDGFYLSFGDGNVFTQNEARGAAANGFLDFGTKSSFTRNTAAGNAEAGFVVAGGGQVRLTGNAAVENGRSGIVTGAVAPVITRNTALNNGRSGVGFDLEDHRPGCGSSIWRANTFLTASRSCIK